METDKKYKILIADDDPFISEIYTLRFQEIGFEVDAAADGKTTLIKARKEKPDIILLDIVIPSTGGFEILQQLRKDANAEQLKIILLTDLGQKEDVEQGLKLGANDYIIKAHFTPSEVVDKVKSILKGFVQPST